MVGDRWGGEEESAEALLRRSLSQVFSPLAELHSPRRRAMGEGGGSDGITTEQRQQKKKKYRVMAAENRW